MIFPYIVQTPVHDWQGGELTALRGEDTPVTLKLELFQRAGSFKARGALSNLLRLDGAARKRGVTAVSAGNHAIATAYAAQVLGVHAKVVMLSSANPARVARARALGAEILIADSGEEGFAEAARLVEAEGRTMIHPFEGRETALGTATIGLEWSNQSAPLDAVLIAIGGGGLCGGLASALKLRWPACRIYGVEPGGADTMKRSVAAGMPVNRDPAQHTIADSLAPPYTLPYAFALCRDHVDAFVTVSDIQIMQAMGVLFREMKLAVEPAGAAAVAALTGPLRDELAGKKVGILICGANIDIDGFADAIRTAHAAGGPV
ncbi:threonine ammonia-lyase [Sphingomonas oryzagri]